MAAWQKKYSTSGRCTLEEALKKAERYCVYQDRCHEEVKRKLYDLGLFGAEVDQLMAKLIEDRFLDEERFARSYTRGKFRMKKWGRVRITRELKLRKLSAYCIKAGLSEIEEEHYMDTFRQLLIKRFDGQKTDLHPYTRRQDLINYALRKGYETHLAVELAHKIIPQI